MGKMLHFTISAVQKSVRKRVYVAGERLVECLLNVYTILAKKAGNRAGFSEDLSAFFEIVQSLALNIFLLKYVTYLAMRIEKGSNQFLNEPINESPQIELFRKTCTAYEKRTYSQTLLRIQLSSYLNALHLTIRYF